MSFWRAVAEFFRGPPPPAHPAIVLLRARRDAYVAFVRATAITKAVLEAASTRSDEFEMAALLWEERARAQLPDDLREAVQTLAIRLRASQEAAAALAIASEASLGDAEATIAVMAAEDLRLMQNARNLGLDVRDLTVEMDIGELRKQADRKLLDALAAGGALEPDEDRDFLEKLFDGFALKRRAPLHS